MFNHEEFRKGIEKDMAKMWWYTRVGVIVISLFAIGMAGVVIWAIIKLVNHFTQ